MSLKSSVSITTPFLRSANIEKDLSAWFKGQEGYIHTPLGRSLIRRIIDGIIPGGNRAWSLLGPYGSGKSTFLLALIQMLGMDYSSVLEKLEIDDPELKEVIINTKANGGKFLPIMITGHQGLISPAIHTALTRTIKEYSPMHPELKPLVKKIGKTDPYDGQAICSFIEQLSLIYNGGGILIAIDELGKFLEYSSSSSTSGDIYILQTLAELATRSIKPLVFITVLHQAFDNYFDYMGNFQKEELAKIQGRFESITFQQPVEQILRLLNAAIELENTGEVVSKIKIKANSLAQQAILLKILNVESLDNDEFINLLIGTAPLHPATAILLGPLFRKLAQNERSLFAFLTSNEPFGFQDYLNRTSIENIEFLSPDQVYDYISATFGTAIYQTPLGRKWAQIDTTLNRLHNPTLLETRIIKLIGLMSLMGDIGKFSPTREVIQFCLGFDQSELIILDRLRKQSLIVWRSFSNSYRLWDGSDVDIEEKINKARQHIDESMALDLLLNEINPPRPMVARRHSYQTGTLRFFEVRYASTANLKEVVVKPLAEAEGKVIYILFQSDQEKENIISQASSLIDDNLCILVFIRLPQNVQLAALELKRLIWVKDNTPELSNDFVARKELYSRITETEYVVKGYINKNFIDENKIEAYYMNCSIVFDSVFQFNQFLSNICDDVYRESPVIRNELINRRRLSSSAAKARNILLQAMIENENEYRLGIEGNPPQLSMYLSLLQDIHINHNGYWSFVTPDQDNQLEPVWRIWENYLHDARNRRISVSELFDLLRTPPVGLLDGVIPIYVLAMFLERNVEIALYENGSFIPLLTVPTFERLLKNPSIFEIRYCPLETIHRDIFRELGKIGLINDNVDNQLLGIVRSLCVFAAKLPYYSRNTRSLSQASINVRNALLSAREPDKLLYEDLPRSLDMKKMEEIDDDPDWAKTYAQRLKESIREIGRSYNDMLDQISNYIAVTMSISRDNTRPELRRRISRIEGLMIDTQLKGFCMRVLDDSKNDSLWLEAIATFVSGKPPSAWSDNDLFGFNIKLKQLEATIQRLEILSLAIKKENFSNSDVVRLGVTTNKGVDLECITEIKEEQKMKIDSAIFTIQKLLIEKFGNDDKAKIAAIARLSEDLLSADNKKLYLSREHSCNA